MVQANITDLALAIINTGRLEANIFLADVSLRAMTVFCAGHIHTFRFLADDLFATVPIHPATGPALAAVANPSRPAILVQKKAGKNTPPILAREILGTIFGTIALRRNAGLILTNKV